MVTNEIDSMRAITSYRLTRRPRHPISIDVLNSNTEEDREWPALNLMFLRGEVEAEECHVGR